MHVREIMSQPVITCPIDASLNLAAQLMWEHDCGVIPVVDHDGRLAGMVTDRDICMAAYTQGAVLSAIPVVTAMTPHAMACRLDDTVETAEELMRDGQFRRVPVIDYDGRPAGIVAMTDLARQAARDRISNIDRDIVYTLAAICTPRSSANREGADRATDSLAPASSLP